MAVFKNVIIKKYGYPVENVESLVVVDVNLPKGISSSNERFKDYNGYTYCVSDLVLDANYEEYIKEMQEFRLPFIDVKVIKVPINITKVIFENYIETGREIIPAELVLFLDSKTTNKAIINTDNRADLKVDNSFWETFNK